MPGLRLAAARLQVQHPYSGRVRPCEAGRIVAKLRMEKKGRGGKMVTVIDGLPNNAAFLKISPGAQARLRHRRRGGGRLVEIQGDLRDRVRELLLKKGYVVKG